MPHHEKTTIDAVCAIARRAGAHILQCRQGWKGDNHVNFKDDNSPVTQADQGASDIIVRELTRRWPEIPAVSEEAEPFPDVSVAQRFWLIDPLDGTKGFIKGEDEFTVNIGLIENERPVLGVIYIPAQDVLYYGAAGVGAFRQRGQEEPEPIHCRRPPPEGFSVVVSRYHASPKSEALLAEYKVTELVQASSSLKFCRVAEGAADLYPRLGRTMEWDTAAGHAIVEAAGGRVTTLEGAPFLYQKPGFENPGFLVMGAPSS